MTYKVGKFQKNLILSPFFRCYIVNIRGFEKIKFKINIDAEKKKTTSKSVASVVTTSKTLSLAFTTSKTVVQKIWQQVVSKIYHDIFL